MNKSADRFLTIDTSAAGARAKPIITYNPSTGQVKSGQAKAPTGYGIEIT